MDIAPFRRLVAFLALALLLTATVAASSALASAAAYTGADQPVLFASAMDRFFSFFEGMLSDRKRMLQFGLVMMLLGLWIIWWNKK